MRQLQKRGSERQLVPPAIQNDLIPHFTTDSILIKETETTVTTRERTYLIPRPVCMHCGKVKERIIGAYFECVNEDCPSHDPDPAAAIPLREEGKKLIDIEPIKEAA